MKCSRCDAQIREGDERDFYGQMLCEECYMDALSPTRTCDPWAVHSAKQLGDKTGGLHTSPVQDKILKFLLKPAELNPEI